MIFQKKSYLDNNSLLSKFKNEANQDNKISLDVVAIYLASTKKDYYPKLKDSNGVTLKTPEGKDLRTETPQGYSYTFTTIGDNPQTVMIVFKDSFVPSELGIYQFRGLGYNIQKSKFIFIDDLKEVKRLDLDKDKEADYE